jgi:hypothetical protein
MNMGLSAVLLQPKTKMRVHGVRDRCGSFGMEAKITGGRSALRTLRNLFFFYRDCLGLATERNGLLDVSSNTAQ